MGCPSTVATGCLGLGVSAVWATHIAAKKANIHKRSATLKWLMDMDEYILYLMIATTATIAVMTAGSENATLMEERPTNGSIGLEHFDSIGAAGLAAYCSRLSGRG